MFLKYESLYLAEFLPNNIFPISRATPKPFFRAGAKTIDHTSGKKHTGSAAAAR
jgi:hypothetical protein